MPIDRPPDGLEVQSSHDGFHLLLRPFQPSLRISSAAVVAMALVLGLALIAVAIGSPTGMVVGTGAAAAGFASAAMTFWHNGLVAKERRRTTLDVRIGRDELRLTEVAGGVVLTEVRHYLRDLADTRVWQAARGPHVVATFRGEPVRIPMERHSTEAACWLAAELTQAARTARERDGAGPGEVPPELKDLGR